MGEGEQQQQQQQQTGFATFFQPLSQNPTPSPRRMAELCQTFQSRLRIQILYTAQGR